MSDAAIMAVWSCPDGYLKENHRTMLAMLARRALPCGGHYVSNHVRVAELAAATNYSQTFVRQTLRELERGGYVNAVNLGVRKGRAFSLTRKVFERGASA